jgi:thymidine kinase
MIKAYIGPMNAGKTFQVSREITQKLSETNAFRVIVFDLVNSRNSERDLNRLYPDLVYPSVDFAFTSEASKKAKEVVNLDAEIFSKLMAGQEISQKSEDQINQDREFIEVKRGSLLVIDEVHLYQVLDKEAQFWRMFNMAKQNNADIILSGIMLDGFNKGKVFKIWEKLLPHIDIIYNMKSRTACKLCGSNINVFFSVPNDFNKKGVDKIGDDYYNICLSCFNRNNLI